MDEKTIARFWSKVDKNGPVPEKRPELGPCWVWRGYQRGGYGAFTIGERRIAAHRFVYETELGPIPDDKLVCHHCDDPFCVNPGHLFLGSHSDNVKDMLSKGRMPIRRGAEAGSALTEELVREIRTSPESNHALAKRLGVSSVTVRRVRLRERWAHVP